MAHVWQMRSTLAHQGSRDARDYVACPAALHDAPPGRMLGLDTEYVEVAGGGFRVGCIAVVQLDPATDTVTPLLTSHVRIDGDVVDYKTAISGLTPENTGGGMSMEALRAWWADNIALEDFICCHDAPCDFDALGRDVSTVPRLLDTVVLWPHHDGPPFKHSLQFLAATFLNTNIQVPGYGSTCTRQPCCCAESSCLLSHHMLLLHLSLLMLVCGRDPTRTSIVAWLGLALVCLNFRPSRNLGS